MIKLYAEPDWDSPYVCTVLVALEEKRLTYEVEELDLEAGEQRQPGYRQRSLTGKVPALDHDGFVLSESLAIVEYLEETFPAPAHARLLPEAPRERARARQVLCWLKSDLMALRDERPSSTIFLRQPATTPLGPAAVAAAEKLIAVASQLLSERPRAGEAPLFGAFSIVDADLSVMIHRLLASQDPVPEAVAAYARAIWQRPSLRKFIEHARRPAGV